MKLVFILIGGLLFLSGCSDRALTEKDLAPLRIGLMPTMDSVAIATAYELGLFEVHDVAVELVPFASARDRDSAFIAGALDGATVDLIAVGLFNEGGIPTRATSVTTAHFTLIAQADFDDLASLKDGTVMISHHTAIDFVLDAMLEAHGLANDYVVREEVGNIPARFEMVRAGLAEAAVISEPFATMAVVDGLAVITDTFLIDFNPFALAFSLEVIEERSAELRAFYQAYLEAVEYLNESPMAKNLDRIVDLIGFPMEVVSYISMPTFLSPVVPEREIIEKARDWLVEKGLISVDTPLDDFIFDLKN